MNPKTTIKTTLLAAIAALFLPVPAKAQDTRTKVFDGNFRSLRACLESNYYAPPVAELGSSDRIRVEFDELAPEMRYMRYSILHCDAEWRPSQLVESDYVDGFNEANVDEYDFSSATLANYVHYGISLPNDDMPILLSGNYLLKVYPEGEPDRPLLQVRFCMLERQVDVETEVTSRTDIDYNSRHQQISVAVNSRNYRIENPYSDLKVTVAQNSRSDNEARVSHPLRVSGNKIYFEHDKQLIFPAGNEFRRFEMTTTNYMGIGIASYSFHAPYYHADLKTDTPRAGLSYTYDQTQYGRFTIRESDASDSDTQADYMLTHFSLRSPEMTGGAVYVDGEFTHHDFTSANRMRYNRETGCYELDMPLKQGAYNYQYLWIPEGKNVALTDEIEGDYYQTINEYQVKVYNRRRGERYDRLIGYAICYSGV